MSTDDDYDNTVTTYWFRDCEIGPWTEFVKHPTLPESICILEQNLETSPQTNKLWNLLHKYMYKIRGRLHRTVSEIWFKRVKKQMHGLTRLKALENVREMRQTKWRWWRWWHCLRAAARRPNEEEEEEEVEKKKKKKKRKGRFQQKRYYELLFIIRVSRRRRRRRRRRQRRRRRGEKPYTKFAWSLLNKHHTTSHTIYTYLCISLIYHIYTYIHTYIHIDICTPINILRHFFESS